MIQPPLLQELVDLNSPAFQNLAKITIFTLMLSIGTRLTLPELASLWQRPRWVARSLLAVVVLVPLTVVVALFILALSHAENAVPVLIAYLIIGFVIALPHSVWSKRTVGQLLWWRDLSCGSPMERRVV
jgi:predicted Na+-dependent transporter